MALNRDLAPYSGSLASAYAKHDSDDIQRDIRKGGELEGEPSALLEEQSDLKDNISETILPLQQIGISILTIVTKILNVIFKIVFAINPIVTMMQNLIEIFLPWTKGKQDDPALTKFFDEVANGAFDGKRPDFPARNRDRR